MELIILSTVAAVTILIAELRDLTVRHAIGRPAPSAATPRLTALTDVSAGSRSVKAEPAEARPELDRAA